MELKAWPLNSKYRTVQEIKYAVHKYAGDLKEFPDIMKMNVSRFYDYVKNFPYSRDVPESEIVSRPKYLLTLFPSLDCKKKAILFASFMYLKHGPGSYRFVISSNRKDGQIGHIFTQIFSGGRWINADATYSHNKIGGAKKVTNFEIVGG
jgi:transglutaminase-like putative cysteine protease